MAHTMCVFSIAAKFSTWGFLPWKWCPDDDFCFPSGCIQVMNGSLVTIVTTKNGLFSASKPIYNQENDDNKEKFNSRMKALQRNKASGQEPETVLGGWCE